jgi:hypothetical protein
VPESLTKLSAGAVANCLDRLQNLEITHENHRVNAVGTTIASVPGKASDRRLELPARKEPSINSGNCAGRTRMMKKKSGRSYGGAIIAATLVGCAALPGLASAASVSYSAHSNSGTSSVLANATLVNYGTAQSPSYGVRNSGENGSSPNHAIDNDGRIDAVKISFSDSVRLTGVTFGWGPGDTDFSVLYSTTAAPCLLGNNYSALLSCAGANWSLLNNYNSSGTGLKNLSNTTIFARNWLVVAYGAFGNNCAGNTQDSRCDAGDDYFKLSGVQYVERVPEPGTLALLGLGIAGLGLARRRRA